MIKSTTANVGTLNEPLANNFDKDRVNAEVGAQVQISQEYGKEIPKAIGDYASNQHMKMILEGRVDEADKWDEGGVYRVALHTAVGALATGNIEGAIAGGGTAIEQYKRIVKLVNSGLSYRETATTLGCSLGTVQNAVNWHGGADKKQQRLFASRRKNKA